MHSGIEYDMRVSTFPSRYGEYVTMHILRRSNFQLGFNKLGMPTEVHAGMEMCLQNYPSGLTLIAGPGGSGITTTAYAALFKLNSVEQKILTLEALPEYNLPGLAQNWYGGPKRSSLAETLRLLPLMDVDTLFLGDINTPEALLSAAEVAFSGKRVLATMAAEDNEHGALAAVSDRHFFRKRAGVGTGADTIRALLGSSGKTGKTRHSAAANPSGRPGTEIGTPHLWRL
jgi:type II secretory ATPase GspE/PulE/Tfp pilus assembly ATPase PilB-like protein